MASDGNPLFQIRLAALRQAAWREVAMLSGYERVGDLVREVMDAVIDRNVGKVHQVMRRIDKKVGVQLDLELMASAGGPVLPAKRVRRAKLAADQVKGRGGP